MRNTLLFLSQPVYGTLLLQPGQTEAGGKDVANKPKDGMLCSENGMLDLRFLHLFTYRPGIFEILEVGTNFPKMTAGAGVGGMTKKLSLEE